MVYKGDDILMFYWPHEFTFIGEVLYRFFLYFWRLIVQWFNRVQLTVDQAPIFLHVAEGPFVDLLQMVVGPEPIQVKLLEGNLRSLLKLIQVVPLKKVVHLWFLAPGQLQLWKCLA